MAAPDGENGWATALSFMNTEIFDKYINCEKVQPAIELLGQRVLNNEVAKRMYDCVKNNITLPDAIEYMYTFADQFSTDEWSKIGMDKLCGFRATYSDIQAIYDFTAKHRQGLGYGEEDSKLFTRINSEGTKTALKKFIEAQNGVCGGSSRRRKRATNTITCEDIYEEQNMISARDTADFADMDATEFKDCVGTIGQLDLPTTHFTAFATRGKAIIGTTDKWSSETVQSMGGIMSGLTEADLKALPKDALDFDAMTSIGSVGNWDDPSKTTALADHYITNHLGGGSAMSMDDLDAMGGIIGGLTTSHINIIPADAYCGAAADIGSSDNMQETQQVAWATHAKTCFGSDIAKWTATDVTAVGVVIGGLPDADIAKLSQTHIQQISPRAIRLMPAKKFASFTATQLGYLNVNQAQAVTDNQLMSLDAAKRKIILGKLGIVEDKFADKGDASTIKGTITLAVVFAMTSLAIM